MAEPLTLTSDAWTSFESRLRAYVRRRVDSASEDDVLGAILLRLVQHQEALEAAENPSAWVFRVAANTITDHYRRRSTEQRLMAQAEAEYQEKVELATPIDDSASVELAQCIIPLIQRLPEPYSSALLLTEIEGITQSAAAKRLGCSTSGMKSRVQRGRVKLKQALLRCCEVHIDRRGGVRDYQPHSKPCKDCLPYPARGESP